MIRLFSIGMEMAAAAIWLDLIRNARYGIQDPIGRSAFRFAAVVLLMIAATSAGGTFAAIIIDQPVLITTWTPVVAMTLTICVGAGLGVVFHARKITLRHQPPVWHPERVHAHR